METANDAAQPRTAGEIQASVVRPHFTVWGAVFLAVIGALFGYWKNSIAAGAFAFLLSLFVTLVVYNFADFAVYWFRRLELAILDVQREMIRMDTSLIRVTNAVLGLKIEVVNLDTSILRAANLLADNGSPVNSPSPSEPTA